MTNYNSEEFEKKKLNNKKHEIFNEDNTCENEKSDWIQFEQEIQRQTAQPYIMLIEDIKKITNCKSDDGVKIIESIKGLKQESDEFEKAYQSVARQNLLIKKLVADEIFDEIEKIDKDLKEFIEEHRTVIKDDYSLGITQILDTIKFKHEELKAKFLGENK